MVFTLKSWSGNEMKIKRVIVICLICSICFLCISGFALKNSQEYEIELLEIEKGEKEEYRERFSISCLGKESRKNIRKALFEISLSKK